MSFVYKMFKLNPDSREAVVSVTSGLGVVTNLLIALIKVVVGLFASSIAIVSEGINNASDALTSILTFIGVKLAGKHPDEKHPFGYGRVEYLTSLIISILILITGIELVKSSIQIILHPKTMKISYVSMAVIAISAIIKFVLGTYTVKMGKKVDSKALEASGLDGRNDSFVSVLTLLSSFVYLIFHYSIDAYVGIFTSVLILKTGLEVLKDTISELLGRPGNKELAKELYKRIQNTEGVLGVADMMIHNYGPEAYSGSVNIEVDHEMTVGEIYQIIHQLQLDILHEKNVTMVFGIYAVDKDGKETGKIRKDILAYIRNQEHIKSYHALYLDEVHNILYVDFIVDYDLRDWQGLENSFKEYMKLKYPIYSIALTIETEFV